MFIVLIEKEQHGLIKHVNVAISILLGTFPIQAVFYYQIAPYSLLLNLLVIPLVGVLLVCGILIQVFGLFSLSGAKVFGTVGGWLLALFSGAGDFTLALPGKQWIVGKPSAYQVFLYLTILVIVLAIMLYLFMRRYLPRLLAILTGGR